MSSILCIVESKTGNTLTFLDFLSSQLNEKMDVYINDYGNIPSLENYEKIIIGTYTWSTGKIPSPLKKFIIENHKDLKDKNILCFGSGNSVYPKFCGAIDGLKIICIESGCKEFHFIKFEQRFRRDYLTNEEVEEIKRVIKKFNR